MAHRVRYCGASECQLSGELGKSLARARKVEDDPNRVISMPRRISIAFGAKRTVSGIYEYAAC